MDTFFKFSTPIVYWILIIVWGIISIFYFKKIRLLKRSNKFLKLLLVILAIDALRSFLESIYFGAWFTSFSGIIPIRVFNFLSDPKIVFIPKIINLIVALLILYLIVKKWLVYELIELNKTSHEQRVEILKLSTAVNQSGNSIVITDLKGNIEYTNQSFTKVTGYTAKEVLGKNPRILNSGEQSKEFYSNMWKTVSAGDIWKGEFKNKKKNGKSFSEEVTISPIKNDVGEIINYLAIKNDISKLKENEKKILKQNKDLKSAKEELEESGKSYKDVVETTSDLITVVDNKGKIIFTNHASLNFYGLTPKESNGKSAFEFIHPEDVELTKKLFRKWIKSDKNIFEHENRQVSRTGTTLNVSWKIHVERKNNEVLKITSIGRDITTQKRTKNDLNEAEKLAGIGSWTFDVSTQKDEWSDETFKIWGLDVNNGVPDFDQLTGQIHNKEAKLFRSSIDNAINIGIPYTIEFRIFLPTEEQKTIKAICEPILDAHGKVVSLKGTNQDITSQKQFEKAQVKHQRLKATGEMSAAIAHDFNNSLQQMTGNLEIIKFQKDLSENTTKRLNNIGTIIDDVVGRVRALQQFGDQEHENSNHKNVNINTLIKQSLMQSRPLWKDGMEKDGFEIQVVTDFGDIPEINCNSGELKSAIHNIIKNGIEAMPEGGDLTIKTSAKDERVFVTFTDTGIGMNKEVQLKLFDPFFSTKGFKLGRGLGMSGVYNTVKKYGGDIVVKSSVLGKGTTFEIVFPIAQYDEMKVLDENDPKEKKNYRVLWVDDDPIITENVSELLGLIGHTCAIENNGKDALAYLDKNTCDIVFTDIGMPGMNGWELIAAVREKFGNDMKIVTVSGWAIDAQVKKEHAIDFVLQKPFTLDALEEFFYEIRNKKFDNKKQLNNNK